MDAKADIAFKIVYVNILRQEIIPNELTFLNFLKTFVFFSSNNYLYAQIYVEQNTYLMPPYSVYKETYV
jgi:hypothetical protein